MNKLIRNIILVFSIFALIGCKTAEQITYPTGNKQVLKDSMRAAELAIESKGKEVNAKDFLAIIKIKGEKLINGMWCWRSVEWNGMWVAGLTGWANGKWYVKVGCNPTTMEDIVQKVAKHEFGHYYLMSNFNDWTHNPLYKDVFFNWNEPRVMNDDKMKSMDVVTRDGQRVHVDYFLDEEVEE